MTDSTVNYGYHVSEIPKGQLGELSKIVEEIQEAMDASLQDNPVMILLELSDMLGAVKKYLAKHHPSITLQNLITMAEATERAFESGVRK